MIFFLRGGLNPPPPPPPPWIRNCISDPVNTSQVRKPPVTAALMYKGVDTLCQHLYGSDRLMINKG